MFELSCLGVPGEQRDENLVSAACAFPACFGDWATVMLSALRLLSLTSRAVTSRRLRERFERAGLPG